MLQYQINNRKAFEQMLEDILKMLIYLGDVAGPEHRAAIEEHIKRMVERVEE